MFGPVDYWTSPNPVLPSQKSRNGDLGHSGGGKPLGKNPMEETLMTHLTIMRHLGGLVLLEKNHVTQELKHLIRPRGLALHPNSDFVWQSESILKKENGKAQHRCYARLLNQLQKG